jgi:hypothetical protein
MAYPPMASCPPFGRHEPPAERELFLLFETRGAGPDRRGRGCH